MFFQFVSEQWVLVSVLLVLVYVYVFTEKAKGGKGLSIHMATQMINRDEAVIVDVREAADFKQGHIADALNIPFNKVNDKLRADQVQNKNAVLVDKMGQHAGLAGRTAQRRF